MKCFTILFASFRRAFSGVASSAATRKDMRKSRKVLEEKKKKKKEKEEDKEDKEVEKEKEKDEEAKHEKEKKKKKKKNDADGWANTPFLKLHKKAFKSKTCFPTFRLVLTDRPKDGLAVRWMDKPSACLQLNLGRKRKRKRDR